MFTQFYMLSFIIGVIFAYQWTGPLDLLKVIWLIFLPRKGILFAVLLGALAVFLAASYHQNKQLAPELWQVPQEIQIIVESHRALESYLQQYQVFSETLNQSFKLSHYKSSQQLRLGRCYQLTVKLKPRHALGNPTTTDQAKQFWANKSFVQGHIVDKESIQEVACLRSTLATTKVTINQFIESISLTPTSKAMVKALVIGERSGLMQTHWEVMQKTGTSHLMAISGLHIGLVYVFCNGLGSLIFRPFGIIFLRVNFLIVSRVFALCSAGIYVLISGSGVSSLRAWGMMALVTVLTIKREKFHGLHILLMVVAIILLLDPLAGMGIGLWLSAGAVFALIWLKTNNWQVHWKLAIILFPITALWLKASLISPVANAIAIPYVSFLVVPGALISVMMDLMHIPGSVLVMQCVGWLIDQLWMGLVWISQSAYLLQWSLLTWVDWVLFIALIICLLLPWRFVGAIPIMILMASLTWAKPILPDQGVVLLHVIDAGQGTALLVQVGEKNLLFDVGSNVVTDYLLHYRVKKLNVAIISHRDKDHRAGLADLLEHIPIEKLYIGESLSETNQTIPCLAGESWIWEEVRFEFLSPSQNGYKGNNASCVLKISIGEHSMLFTGDIERKVEVELLRTLNPSVLKSTVLIAPHHGSKTSSTADFIQAVSPQIVIYPTGFLNSYHHPHPVIIERYAEFDVKQYNTAQDGALSVKLSKHGIEAIHCYKKDHAYWWNRDEEATCSGYLAQAGY